MNELTSIERGGYYTPWPIAQRLSQWALQGSPKSILEPSCGDGVFLAACAPYRAPHSHLTACELVPKEAQKARAALTDTRALSLKVGDFLSYAVQWLSHDTRPPVQFDAIIGNPPFIRSRRIAPSTQSAAATLYELMGLRFTKQSNTWAYFLVACMGLLAPRGRLAMVIPTELMHVLYAQPVRDLLLTHSRRVTFITLKERAFPDLSQGVGLLLIEKKQAPNEPSQGLVLLTNQTLAHSAHELEQQINQHTPIAPSVLTDKWSIATLGAKGIRFIQDLSTHKVLYSLDALVHLHSGITTGCNEWFIVDSETVKQYALHDYALPVLHGLNQASGLLIQTPHDDDSTKYVIAMPATPIEAFSAPVRRYIEQGQALGFHQRYKCAQRPLWYHLRLSKDAPPLLLPRGVHHVPRLIANPMKAHALDSVIHLYPRAAVCPYRLTWAFINPLTALSAEISGRYYGGGLLNLTPNEARRISVVWDTSQAYDLSTLHQKALTMNAEDLMIEQAHDALRPLALSANEHTELIALWLRMKRNRQGVNT